MYPHHKYSKIKIAFWILLIIGVAVVYDRFFTRNVRAQSTAASALNAEATLVLGKIEALQLDGSILTDPAFLSLIDFSVEIEAQPKGRPNPFAPIPGAARPSR
jgi:hypothetical protein